MSDKETKQDSLPPREPGKDTAGKIRVLLVDDEEGICECSLQPAPETGV
jgi:hypothetical protein